ncbi:MAG TPA: hypothetical protein VMT03_20620 [Polyangia bacterium]|nr:hypothetical protein [Polyangia bacterium]
MLISLAFVLMAGCSSSNDGGGSGGVTADSYVGTWTFQSGSIDPGCPASLNIPAIDLTGEPVTIAKTDSTHISMMIAATDVMCDVVFTVSGSTATAASGQTCAIKASGITANVTVSTWTLMLSDSTINMSMTGTANAIVTCDPTSTGTMVKSGGDAG